MTTHFDEKDAEDQCLMASPHMKIGFIAGARWQFNEDLRTMVPKEKVEKLVQAIKTVDIFFHPDDYLETQNNLKKLVMLAEEFEAEG